MRDFDTLHIILYFETKSSDMIITHQSLFVNNYIKIFIKSANYYAICLCEDYAELNIGDAALEIYLR